MNTTVPGNTGMDIGRDGLPIVNNANSPVAKDAMGFALHYYDAVEGSDAWMDYRPISGISAFARPAASSGFVSLYNGNIGAISLNNTGLNKGAAAATNALPLFNRYRYDQLNRIVSMQAYKGLNAGANQWTPIALDDYKESVGYDPNGNILAYQRNGVPATGKPTAMDSLTYYYDANTNRLNHVDDSVGVNAYAEDLDDQSAGNYTYDAIGNLKTDGAAGITGIAWTVYGKIDSITKSSNGIKYSYDAAGNRISKTVDGKTTVYVRDASGNVMSIYEKHAAMTLKQIEVHLYGSSRLGMATALTTAPASVNLEGGYAPALLSTFTRGEKIFEMSNHLGNVLTTISDRKLQHTVDSTNRDYYEADILTATDYYPFGMILPGRAVALSPTACHEEIQDATELRGSSNLDSGVTFSGTEIHQNGVRWVRSATTATISLYNQSIKVDNGGNSGDGVYVYIPTGSIEANTTYVMEFDITDKSAGISYFNCQAHTPGDDVYRVITRKTGSGHHAILFTTPAVLPSYVRLRITANIVSSGTYFVVDNFVCRKYTVATQTQEVGTDFNTAVMSGVNVSSDGLLWTPLNSSITSFSVVGTTDKKLKVTCTSVDEAWLKLETGLTGGRNYILRFAMTQDTATKRLGLRFYARTSGTWTMTETQGLIYTGNGNYLVNFTHPAGADAIRVEFLRSNSGQSYDGYNTPYTIDDFSISRLDTASKRTVTVCDPPAEGEEGLYRYGFNGKENDWEAKGWQNQQDYGMRIYDPRVGRFLSVDPITREYPELTPYQFASNRPIDGIDQDGMEFEKYLLDLGLWTAGKIDDEAEKIRNKPTKTTSDKILLFSSGLAKSTPFGAIHQIKKTGTQLEKMTPQQRAQATEGYEKQSIGILTTIFTDVFRGRAPGTTGIEMALTPTLQKAIDGDYEAMGELTGIFFQAVAPKFFNAPKTSAMAQLSKLEQNIVYEADAVLNSKQFQLIRNAYEKGIEVEVKINKGTVIYNPNYTYSEAMTLHGEGFMLGPKAFTAKGGVEQTVLWEITRLKTQNTGYLDVELTKPYTQNAEATSEKLLPHLKQK